MKKILFLFSLCGISLLWISWGSQGHHWINYNCTESFPTSMNSFMMWADSLAAHGSDADDRKSWDPNESMRHFIDIDNYAEFNSTGHIALTEDTAVTIHGINFVRNNGTLPWATKIMYDSLKLEFQLHNWHHAMLHASDLGHYVGDGHQPLHITANYDGQNTGNDGVHSRYETDMVNSNLTYLRTYPGDTVHVITNVQQYIMDYLYLDFKYKDSVLIADTYATNLAGNTNSTQYYQALFSKTGAFTLLLWHNASHSLAELIYTAWVAAGSPTMPTSIEEAMANPIAASISPNPVTDHSALSFFIPVTSKVKLSIIDNTGKIVYKNENVFPSGDNRINMETSFLSKGIYFIKIENGKISQVIRFLKP
jgi:hypothetical protein